MRFPNKTMKTIRRVIQVGFIVLFFLSMSMSVYASDNSGSSLVEKCSGKRGAFLEGVCWGMIAGFDYGYSSKMRTTYCVPSEVNKGQIIKVVRKYIDEHPEKLHELYGKLIVEALNESFPCQ